MAEGLSDLIVLSESPKGHFGPTFPSSPSLYLSGLYTPKGKENMISCEYARFPDLGSLRTVGSDDSMGTQKSLFIPLECESN
jgi:hypothetical protein